VSDHCVVFANRVQGSYTRREEVRPGRSCVHLHGDIGISHISRILDALLVTRGLPSNEWHGTNLHGHAFWSLRSQVCRHLFLWRLSC